MEIRQWMRKRYPEWVIFSALVVFSGLLVAILWPRTAQHRTVLQTQATRTPRHPPPIYLQITSNLRNLEGNSRLVEAFGIALTNQLTAEGLQVASSQKEEASTLFVHLIQETKLIGGNKEWSLSISSDPTKFKGILPGQNQNAVLRAGGLVLSEAPSASVSGPADSDETAVISALVDPVATELAKLVVPWLKKSK